MALRSIQEIEDMLDKSIEQTERCGKGTQSRLFQHLATIALAWVLKKTDREPIVKDMDL